MKLRVTVVFLLTLLLSGPTMADPPTEPRVVTRVVTFDGGSAVLTNDGVEMRTVDGKIAALSTCGGGSGGYDEIVAFAKNFRELVVANKRREVAELVLYPLEVNRWKGPRHIRNQKELLAHYDELFDPTEIRQIQPNYVFCRTDAAMLLNGEMWIQEDEHGQLKIVVINK